MYFGHSYEIALKASDTYLRGGKRMSVQSKEAAVEQQPEMVVGSAKTRKTIAMILMIAMTVLSFFSFLVAAASYIVYGSYEAFYTSDYLYYLEMILLLLEVIFNLIWSAFYLAFIIVFLMWFHRVYKRLQYFGVQGLSDTPAWAVGWYFIPFVGIVKPYFVMRQVWHAALYAESESTQWRRKRTRWLIVWWVGFLAAGFMYQLSLMSSYETAEDYKRDALFVLIGEPLYMISGVLLLIIMHRVTKVQDEELPLRMQASESTTIDGDRASNDDEEV